MGNAQVLSSICLYCLERIIIDAPGRIRLELGMVDILKTRGIYWSFHVVNIKVLGFDTLLFYLAGVTANFCGPIHLKNEFQKYLWKLYNENNTLNQIMRLQTRNNKMY